jgi:hypothetical protein
MSMAAFRKAALSAMVSACGAMGAAGAAEAGNQSSNTSSNSSSNNGVVRERIDSSYCTDRYCERTIERRTYRDDERRPRWPRDDDRRRYR